MLSYIQLILLLSSLLSSPTTITSTYSTLFNASTLVLIVALPFLVSYYSTPIRIETALFDTTAIDDYFDNLIDDSDNNTENIIDDADLSATVDDGYSADESDLEEIFTDSDDINVADSPRTPASFYTKAKIAKADLAPFADELYYSDSEDEDEDEEASMNDPFNVPDNYQAGTPEVSSVLCGLSTRRWELYKEFDAPVPWSLEPTCDKNLDGTPLIDDEDDEEIEQDVWGYVWGFKMVKKDEDHVLAKYNLQGWNPT